MKFFIGGLVFSLTAIVSAGEMIEAAAVPTGDQRYSAAEIHDQLQQRLFAAARSGDADVLQAFIEAGYNLDSADGKGYTPLILAAYNGRTAAVQQLLQAGANPCQQDKRGNSALMGAIFKGELRIARHLMSADCAVDQRNNAGQTAAMYAALFQRTEMLEDLRTHGADMQAADPLGNTPQRLMSGDIRSKPQL